MNRKISPTLIRLSVLFTSCLVISNILANRLLQVGPWSIDAGILLFPITYVLSDLFSEVYGYKWSRRITWWAAIMNLVFAVLVSITNMLPAPEYFDPAPFQLALGSSFRIVVASLVSYVTGDWVNDIVFRRMRRDKNAMQGFTFRALISSLLGQIADSTLFVSIAFAGTMPFSDLVNMAVLGIVAKIGYEIIILPVTYKLTQAVYKKESIYNNQGGITNE